MRPHAPDSDCDALLAGISVVIPVFNSEATLDELASRLEHVLEASGMPFEVILVNDASRDGSWARIDRLCQTYPWICAVNLMGNHGQENALLCGIRLARYDLAVMMDDDLQNPPEEIPKLLAAMLRGNDVVYGTPQREQHGLWRDLASVVTKRAMQGAMGAANASNVTAFKAMRTRLRNAFAGYHSRHVSIDVLLTWGATRFDSVQVRHDPRRVGNSNYTLRKLITHAINMITGFSVVPLQLASVAGLFFALVGVMLLIYVLWDYVIRGDKVPGFPFLAATVAVFSGVQMFTLGVIGEYLARMRSRLMDRPPYSIGQIKRSEPQAAGKGALVIHA